MNPFRSSSESGDGPSGASSGRPEHPNVVAEACPDSIWFWNSLRKNPYPALERLAPHRTILIERLQGVLAPAICTEIKLARTDWEGIKVLAPHLMVPNPTLEAAMDRVIGAQPDLQEALQAASSTPLSGSMPPAALFPTPPVCEGREDIVSKVITIVTGQIEDAQAPRTRSAVLYGIGGIGKSTVALQVLNCPHVISQFGRRRFFAGCENLSTLDAFVGHLLIRLAIDACGRHAETAICQFGMSAPALLVLDNFEDLWNADGPATERFLSSIAKDDGFNLIVTKRGSADLRLPGAHSFPIDTLDRQASLAAFLRHADRAGLNEPSDPDLSELVNRLDGYPLALMLLAYQYNASAGVTAEQLLVTYKRLRTDCLKRGETDNRQTNLRASIDLSLASRAMSTAGAKELCFLLSLLPDGAEDELINAFLTRITPRFPSGPPDLVATKLAVTGAGLASRSAQGLLRMLAPLRELFASLDSIATDTRDDARLTIHAHTGMLVGHSRSIYDQPSAEKSAALRQRVSAQLGNLTENIKARLAVSLAVKEPSETDNAVRNAVDLAFFIWQTVPFVPDFLHPAIEGAKSSGLIQGEADCQRMLGQILLGIDRLDDARSSFDGAMALYDGIDDRGGKGHTLQQLGLLARRKDNLRAAKALLDSALVIFEEIDDQLQTAYTLDYLGEVVSLNDDLRVAEEHLESAHAIFNDINHRLGQANTLQSLGNLAKRRAYLPLAQKHFDKALRIYKDIDHRLGKASAMRSLGDLARRPDDLSLAQERFNDALEVYKDIDGRLGKADTLQSLGNLTKRQGDLPLAQVRFEEALGVYKNIGGRQGEASTLRSLGVIARLRGDLPLAQVRLDEALRVWEEIGCPLGKGNTIKSLGRLALRRDDLPLAQARLNEALSIFRGINQQLGKANALQSLGRLALRQSNLSATQSYLDDALAIYQRIGDRLGEVDTVRLLGKLALEQGELSLAQERFEEVLEVYKNIGGRRGEAGTLQSLGALARLRDDLPLAQARLGEALRVWKEIGCELGRGNTIESLGRLALQQDDLPLAQAHLDEALSIFRGIDQQLGKANALQSLGHLALRQSNLPATQSHLDGALAIYQRIGDRLGEVDTLHLLGKLASEQGDLSIARARFDKALDLSGGIGHGRRRTEPQDVLAEVAAPANTSFSSRLARNPIVRFLILAFLLDQVRHALS